MAQKNTDKKIRHEYVIGDLQGCFGALQQLLDTIDFDETQDRIWFAGDLVARGEDSLATLRLVKRLCEKGAAKTVLGNHDITLIATWRSIIAPKKKDKIQPILDAPDCDELLNWLRHQPILLEPSKTTVLVHAGIPPHWKLKDARKYARELESQLQSSLKQLDRVLPELYAKSIDKWNDKLNGYAKIRAIANYFTRMRLCKADGTLEFSFKASLNDKMPDDFRPWFEWIVPRKRKILFGHWAALKGDIKTPHVQALDGGCVWGNCLMAYRLSDEKIFSVGCQLPSDLPTPPKK